MKSLQKWTGEAGSGERKYKGWSKQGHKVHYDWTKEIKQDVHDGKYEEWENAVRLLYHERKKEMGLGSTAQADKFTFEADTSVVWEL